MDKQIYFHKENLNDKVACVICFDNLREIYYNPKYGFVKLDYTNIDGSKTILELINFTTENDK